MAENQRKLTHKERLAGIWRVLLIAARASPGMVAVNTIGAIISAILPLATTFFAALTTTELAAAYSGDETAGARAMTYIIITASLGVVQLAWASVEGYINTMARYKVETEISDAMYEHFLSLDFWQYDDKKTADLYDKAAQFSRFFGYVFNSMAAIFSAIVALIAGVAALALVSWWLSLLVLIALIPGVVIQFILSKKRTKHWRENTEARRVAANIEWKAMDIRHIAELRIYGLVRHLLDLRITMRDKDQKTRIGFERKFMGWQLGSDVIEAAAEVLSLLYTTTQIIAHVQPVGQLLYVQQVVSRTMGGMRSLVNQLASIDEDLANLFDYNEFMALPAGSTRNEKLPVSPRRIVFDDVSFHYPGSEQPVLSDISFTISKGQHVAIVGENGAGKSTLLKLLLGLYVPVRGSVLLDGADLLRINLGDWHSHIGMLQQEFTHFTFGTARDNVTLGDVSHPVDEKLLSSALERAEADVVVKKLPKGLDTYLGQWMEHDDGTSGVDLSGGQWQRIALARNFYRNSPIVILDEPTSAIDALAESRIFNRLFADKKRTIITVSHRLTTVKKADVILVFHEGRLVEQGTHQDLLNKNGRYVELFSSQL